jgi:hypothetical protein
MRAGRPPMPRRRRQIASGVRAERATEAHGHGPFRGVCAGGSDAAGAGESARTSRPKIARAASQPLGNIPRGVYRQVFRLRAIHNPPSRDSSDRSWSADRSGWHSLLGKSALGCGVSRYGGASAVELAGVVKPRSLTTLPSLPEHEMQGHRRLWQRIGFEFAVKSLNAEQSRSREQMSL